MSEKLAVNEHYLDRLVAAAETRGVEATEDIVSGNGVKLVAKGSSIDARTRERLLQHKLHKPLEACTRIIGGVATRPMDRVARTLIGKHALLAELCAPPRIETIEAAFGELRLTVQLEALVTLYADQAPHKLEHAVGVALVAAALMQEIDATQPLQPLLIAGLLHDVGELYIDPTILARGQALDAAQWRHVAVHPVVAAGLLRELPGAGPAVADAVLHHHERLDGFGYPCGRRGDQIPLSGQVLAMAEMLMGVVESGRSAGQHARILLRLMTHEFDRRLLQAVTAAARRSAPVDFTEAALAMPDAASLMQHAASQTARLHSLQGLMQRLALLQHPSPGFAELLQRLDDRLAALGRAFHSTGLDQAHKLTGQGWRAPDDLPMLCEVWIVLRELHWRLNEFVRELNWRCEQLPAPEAEAIGRVVEDELKLATAIEPALA